MRHRNVGEYKKLIRYCFYRILSALDRSDYQAAQYYLAVVNRCQDTIVRINTIKYGKIEGMSVISK